MTVLQFYTSMSLQIDTNTPLSYLISLSCSKQNASDPQLCTLVPRYLHYSRFTWRASACIALGVSSIYLISVTGGEAQKSDSTSLIACKIFAYFLIAQGKSLD